MRRGLILFHFLFLNFASDLFSHLNMDEENKNEINEPAAPYGREIKIFHSFEEENEYTHSQWYKLTPQQRLQCVYELLTAMYGSEVVHNPNPYKGLPIIIDV